MHFTIRAISHRDDLLSEVIALGNKNSRTLGLFPEGAFLDHAKRKAIIVATEDSAFAGYVLFRISQKKRLVSIVHLCVQEEYRGHKVAIKLLNAVKEKYKDLFRGMSLSCREDYTEACKLWENFGFKAMSKKLSRSKDERFLIKWIYDFGNPDLFSFKEVEKERIKAVIDCSVTIPMSELSNSDNTEAHSLKADWLEDEVEFFYAPEIFNEINRDRNNQRADKTREFLRNYEAVKFKPDERDLIYTSLEPIKPGTSKNDISDRKQLAECIASATKYFITLDDGILDLNEVIYKEHGIKILRPTDFILLMDELSNTLDYNSLRLAGANYDQAKMKSEEIEKIIEEFSGVNLNEREDEIRNCIIKCASDAKNGVVRTVKDRDGKRIAFYAMTKGKDEIAVNLIRTKGLRISSVLFQQLVKDIIGMALVRNASIISINDLHLSEAQKSVLLSNGFERRQYGWQKITLRGLYSTQELLSEDLITKNFDTTVIQKKLGDTEEHTQVILKLQLERKVWPAKLTDIGLPVYIIPIKPFWASQLFDFYIADSNLFGAKEALSWSRENVYYRSVKPVSEKSPGRILWYLSSETKSATGRNKGIVACSYLDEVCVDRVKNVFKKFQHFGVYEWKDIYQLAGKQLLADIKALKFSDTEVFKNIVPLNKITEVMKLHGRLRNSFASPVEVSIDIFNSIYKIGIND
jgi:ribosomal protein S18 acetylase RimI-like enzyme/predicted nucleic acid-binding protein